MRISPHIPKHKKLLNDTELGYYLAGLIDGNGNIDKEIGRITIYYDIKDISSAYMLKEMIGYGRFIDSNGSFQIKILNKLGQKLPEIKLKLQISEVPTRTSYGIKK
ncbi:hypothetical protein DAPK24_040430 (mitochondrion) [Pichia kluyveri]|uniref:Homing endonuclease LAGLIDADG domain-containing protein n=1 Tax=Pichia kluyveri TaxID=36015 RepID=A0AAV5RC96_PICKL|nr:hypothetical protein DAPK24_040430 [Pichia kluyveri]